LFPNQRNQLLVLPNQHNQRAAPLLRGLMIQSTVRQACRLLVDPFKGSQMLKLDGKTEQQFKANYVKVESQSDGTSLITIK
jgi:hypothetical protein